MSRVRSPAGPGRTTLLGALAVALVAAGALGLAGPGALLDGPGEQGSEPAGVTGTPAAASEDATADRSPGDANPPGVDAAGIADRSRLLEAHRTALVAAGFERTLRIEAGDAPGEAGDASGGGGTFVERVAVAEGATAYHRRTRRYSAAGLRWSHDVWSNGSATLARSRQLRNRWRFSRPGGAADPSTLAATGLLGQYLAAGDYAVAGTRERDGRTLTVLTAERYRRPDAAFPPADAVSAFEATVLVDRAGRIHELSARLRVRGRVVVVRYRLTGLGGTTVDRPDWVRKAVLATASDGGPHPY